MKDKPTVQFTCENGDSDLEWTVTYDKRSEEIRHYLKERGSCKSSLFFTRKCFKELKDYLLQRGISYTPDAADEWLLSLDFVENYFQISIARMKDLYTIGQISTINAYPRMQKAFDDLNSFWLSLVNEYFQPVYKDAPETTKKECRNSIAHILYALQNLGIEDLKQVNYDILHEVCEYEASCHQSKKLRDRYLRESSMFFSYLADLEKCVRGFSLYLYYWEDIKDGSFENLTIEQENCLKQFREESLQFPAEEFYALIKPFTEKYTFKQYHERTPATISIFLQKLYLFLELHDTGYHPEIALVFLNIYESFRSESLQVYYRRAIVFLMNTLKLGILPLDGLDMRQYRWTFYLIGAKKRYSLFLVHIIKRIPEVLRKKTIVQESLDFVSF